MTLWERGCDRDLFLYSSIKPTWDRYWPYSSGQHGVTRCSAGMENYTAAGLRLHPSSRWGAMNKENLNVNMRQLSHTFMLVQISTWWHWGPFPYTIVEIARRISECVQVLHTFSALVVYFTNTSNVCSSIITLSNIKNRQWETETQKVQHIYILYAVMVRTCVHT